MRFAAQATVLFEISFGTDYGADLIPNPSPTREGNTPSSSSCLLLMAQPFAQPPDTPRATILHSITRSLATCLAVLATARSPTRWMRVVRFVRLGEKRDPRGHPANVR